MSEIIAYVLRWVVLHSTEWLDVASLSVGDVIVSGDPDMVATGTRTLVTDCKRGWWELTTQTYVSGVWEDGAVRKARGRDLRHVRRVTDNGRWLELRWEPTCEYVSTVPGARTWTVAIGTMTSELGTYLDAAKREGAAVEWQGGEVTRVVARPDDADKVAECLSWCGQHGATVVEVVGTDVVAELLATVGEPATDASESAPEPAVTVVEEPSRLSATVARDALADALAHAGSVVLKRASIDILTGVLLTVTDAGLTVAGFDYETSATATVAVSDGSHGRVLVAAKALADAVTGLPKGSVVTLADDGERLTVTCGGSRFTLPTMPVADYPTLPDMPAQVGSVDVRALADGVAFIAVAAGRDDTLPLMTGIHVVADGGTLRLEATDRYRLTLREVPWSPVGGAKLDAIVPGRTLAAVAKRYGKLAGKTGGTVTIGATGDAACGTGMVALSFGGYTLTTRTLDGTFPKLAHIVPESLAETATVDGAQLSAAVKRLAAMLGKSDPIRLSFAAGSVTVIAKRDGETAGSESVPCEYVGEPMTIGLSAAYLADGLAASGKGRVFIAMSGPRKPAAIRTFDASGEVTPGALYMIMPIRLPENDETDKATEPAAPKAAKRAAKAEAPAAPEPAQDAPAATPDVPVETCEAAPAVAQESAPAVAPEEPPAFAGEPASVPQDAPEPVAETSVATYPGPYRATIAATLRAATWSSAVVRIGRGRARTAAGMDVLTLPAGRLDRDAYKAVADVVGNLGGAWNKEARGFIFEPSRLVWDPKAPAMGRHTKSGKELLTDWLARNASESAPNESPAPDAEVSAETAQPAPVFDAARFAQLAESARDAFLAGDYPRALAAIGEGERMAPDHVLSGGHTWATLRQAVTDAETVERDRIAEVSREAAEEAAEMGSAPVVLAGDVGPGTYGRIVGTDEHGTPRTATGWFGWPVLTHTPDGRTGYEVPMTQTREGVTGWRTLVTVAEGTPVDMMDSESAPAVAVTGPEDITEEPSVPEPIASVSAVTERLDLRAAPGRCPTCGGGDTHTAGCYATSDAGIAARVRAALAGQPDAVVEAAIRAAVGAVATPTVPDTVAGVAESWHTDAPVSPAPIGAGDGRVYPIPAGVKGGAVRETATALRKALAAAGRAGELPGDGRGAHVAIRWAERSYVVSLDVSDPSEYWPVVDGVAAESVGARPVVLVG